MNLPSKQRGAALLMVLLMVSIMLVLSVNLVESVRYSSQRLLNQRYMDQAYWYALGGEYIAAKSLEDVAGEDVIALNQNWARRDVVFPVEGGSIAGLIDDQQACFNVNRLHRPDGSEQSGQKSGAQQVFELLLLNVEVDVQRAEYIGQRLSDWVDSDFSPEGPFGAEDLSYSGEDYPYLPPNQAIDSVSELGLFADFDTEEQEALRPFLCALPEFDTRLNINTLGEDDAPLLAAAIGNLLAVEQIQRLIAERPAEGWASVESFIASLGLPEGQQVAAEFQAGLGVKSSYFLGLADVFYEQRRLRLYSRFVLRNGKAYAYAREYGEVF
jgi:general secretion pathway protein K